MKKGLKITAIVSVAALTLGTAVVAFGGAHLAKDGRLFSFMANKVFTTDRMLSHMKDELKLTEEQETQLRPIIEKQRQKMLDMFEKAQGQRQKVFEAFRQNKDAMWTEIEPQLAEILTAEQMEQAKKMHEEHKGHGRFGHGGRMFQGKAKVHELFEQLNLSDEQLEDIFAIFAKYHEDCGEARGEFIDTRKQVVNLLLNEEFNEERVRQTYRETTAKFEDVVVERAKMVAEMKAVLTDEQIQQLQEQIPQLLEHVHGNMHGKHAMVNYPAF